MSLFRKSVKQATNPEARKAEARKKIQEFISFCSSFTEGKNDKDVDWLNFGYAYYSRFYEMAHEFPELDDFVEWGILKIGPERSYSYYRPDSGWINWSYDQMREHKLWVERVGLWDQYEMECKRHFPGEPFSLDMLGVTGGLPYVPGSYDAYFGFAVNTKRWSKKLLKKLETF